MIPPTPLYEGGEVGMLINMDKCRSSRQDAIVIGFVSTVESVMVVVDDIIPHPQPLSFQRGEDFDQIF